MMSEIKWKKRRGTVLGMMSEPFLHAVQVLKQIHPKKLFELKYSPLLDKTP